MFGSKKGASAQDLKPKTTVGNSENKPKPRAVAPTGVGPRPPQPASRIFDIPGMSSPRGDLRAYGVEGKTLVVGREISLAGQITACDRLLVEGRVEADLDHCRQLDISPSGFFKGSAEIDDAEIGGRFEGRLTVHRRLRVRATARIVGHVTYGQLEVEAGGEIVGDIQVHRPETAAAKPGAAPQARAREGMVTAEAGE